MASALVIGSLLPDQLAGEVCSVHDRAINIRDDAEYRLISILDREADLNDLSVVVDSLPRHVHPGAAAGISSCALTISRAFRPPAVVGWTEATRRFSGRIEPSGARPSRQRTLEVLDQCRNTLRQSGSAEGLSHIATGSLPANDHARKATEILGAAAGSLSDWERQSAGVMGALAGLIGLGPGFTPSGDDFVCGALAAGAVVASSHTAIRTPQGGSTQSAGMGPIMDRLASTTLGGATLVSLACRGSFPAYLSRFAAGFVRELGVVSSPSQPADTALEAAVREAISHGATSGADALAGFIWMMDGFTADQA